MERYEKIARRVADSMTVTVSFLRQAKERPADMFGGVFFDIREKAKKLKQGWEERAVAQLESALRKDLSAKKVQIADLKISLGQYRGSRFVTSAKFKAKVKTEEQAEQLAVYLRGKYSPKYKLKKWNPETNEALFNVR